jgi:hypothetical protein
LSFSGSVLKTHVNMFGGRYINIDSIQPLCSLIQLMVFDGADGIVINMVVGCEVVTLKALEENSGLLIAEMPIHVRCTLLFVLLSSNTLNV